MNSPLLTKSQNESVLFPSLLKTIRLRLKQISFKLLFVSIRDLSIIEKLSINSKKSLKLVGSL